MADQIEPNLGRLAYEKVMGEIERQMSAWLARIDVLLKSEGKLTMTIGLVLEQGGKDVCLGVTTIGRTGPEEASGLELTARALKAMGEALTSEEMEDKCGSSPPPVA